MAALSERDMRLVLDFVGEAHDAQDLATVAAELAISPRTAAKHVQHIHAKLGVTSRAQAVATAWAAAGASERYAIART